MKCMVLIKKEDMEPLQSVFPCRPPMLLPICNKPIIEYIVDFAIICGCDALRLLTDIPKQDVEAIFGDGSRWGIEITYGQLLDRDTLFTTIQKNSRFCNNDRVLILKGFFFLNYNQREDYKNFMSLKPAGEILSGETGQVLIWEGELKDDTQKEHPTPITLSMTRIRTLKDIYKLSLELLSREAESYVLPGYNNQPGVFLGRNVMIAANARIIPPVMIGNNVQIHKHAEIGPMAVIGNDVIIDNHSHVVHSIILDRTYVGEHLELRDKTADGQTLMDPIKMTVMNLEDAHLLSDMNQSTGSLSQKIWHALMALLLLMFLVVPYILLSVLLKYKGCWKREKITCLADLRGKTLSIPRITINTTGLSGRLANSLVLDRFPLFFQVLRGKMLLIGTKPVKAGIKQNRPCRPGVFSYAEGDGWPIIDADQEISERFHLAHRTQFNDLIMVGKAILNMMHDESKQSQTKDP